MPSHKQGTVESPVTERALGSAASGDLRACFSSSPLYAGELTPESIRAQYQAEILDGEINDGGHTFGTFNPNYSEAPDLSEVETGGSGLPASPFVPNPVSPGEGSTDPSDQAAAPEGFGETPNPTPFVGVGSQLSPKAASEVISAQKLGQQSLGKSSN